MNEQRCKKRRRERYEVRDGVAIQGKINIAGACEAQLTLPPDRELTGRLKESLGLDVQPHESSPEENLAPRSTARWSWASEPAFSSGRPPFCELSSLDGCHQRRDRRSPETPPSSSTAY